jgi:plastocyanin
MMKKHKVDLLNNSENSKYSMKYVLLALTILSIISIAPAYAEPSVSSFQTDKIHYEKGDVVTLTGMVTNPTNSTVGIMAYVDHNRGGSNLVHVLPNENGTFSHTIELVGGSWKYSGNVMVRAVYENTQLETEFSYTAETVPEPKYAVVIQSTFGSAGSDCDDRPVGCFYPATATVQQGDKVAFVNADSAYHTFTSELFDSKLIKSGDSFEWIATESTDYFCTVHPWATGHISVTHTEPIPEPTPQPEPTSSGTDWQGKYLEVLSDFNDISARAGELQRENDDLRQQVSDLQKTVDDLNAVLMEQVKVIYDWVLGK